ncbi:MAG: endoglucanase, partial [Caulobacteraceae bacterium]|nr:endoglucanase [Caulobacteraceae bacterium]
AAHRYAAADGAPQPASMPALVNWQDWPKTGSGGFLARYDALMAAAASEDSKGDNASTDKRMALARFLVGSELAYEAIGVLNALAASDPKVTDDAEFRGLRGIAQVMVRRYREAETDFAAPQLAGDPSSALWRSYIAAQGAQWTVARQEFAKGAQAFNQMSPTWKARFARGDAQAALALGDTASANASIRMALMDPTPSAETLATRLLQARIAEAEGYKARALAIYNAISRAPADYLSAPALLRATQIRYEQGQLTPLQAVNVFDGLRYRWRGDATELETIRLLGQLYLGQGRYREALEALRSAGLRLPDLPEAVQLQADLGAAFRALFLDGQADGLQPIQALALFYDFKELTPVGADGDLMVRKLVRRLVDVDLLDQAADLLKYQVENRLDGVARSQVAADLALIYLMDRQPEKALVALNSSRTTVLPNALNAERRVLEGRALMGLGRYDHALEVRERETSADARDLRAEIAWRQKDWAKAGPMLEQGLGERWKTPGALSPDEEARLIRAGAAFSLAGDDAALARLQQRYGPFFAQARNPDALRVALAGLGDGQAAAADFSRLAADDTAFQGWVAKMKQRFREPAATAKPMAPTKQAAAAAPATQG